MSDLEKMRRKAAKLSNPKPVELPSGSFRCRLRIGSKYITATDKDPEIAHAKVLAQKAGLLEEMEAGEREKKGNITLTKAIDKYIEDRDNVLSPTTVIGYRTIQRNRFPALMKTDIRQIDTTMLQKAINEESKKVGCKTIKNSIGLVVAVVSEYKDINTKRIKMPQRKKTEHKYLDEEGLLDLFDAIRGIPTEIPILLAVWLGMRRSEILGLCWDCVDFENKQIKVYRTYLPTENGDYVLREGTKTESSRRTVDCPNYILSKLDAYQPDKSKRTGRVFAINANVIYDQLRKVCRENGIEFVGVHGLRHTNASVMLSLGIIDKIIMARNGWSTDVTLKDTYFHIFKSDQKKSVENINSYFECIAEGINPKSLDKDN